MKKIILLCFIVIYFSTLNCFGELIYSGSSTIGDKLLPELASEFYKATGIEFEKILVPGSGKGMKALINNQADIAGISRKPTKKEKKLPLIFTTIGDDAISVIVHPSNPVKELNLAQLKDIFQGRITNWKEVGGKDEPILPVTEILTEKRATQIVFTELVMETDVLIGSYGTNIKQVDKPADEANEVANNKNAIAAVSFTFSSEKVKSVAVKGVMPFRENIAYFLYPLSRPLVIVIRENASEEAKKFVEFLKTPTAKSLINKYFVGIPDKY